jgi:hypothetical protein
VPGSVHTVRTAYALWLASSTFTTGPWRVNRSCARAAVVPSTGMSSSTVVNFSHPSR